MEIALPSDFSEFLKSLRGKKVEYLLIGGYAVAYHGYPRATNDLDIWIASSSDNAERVVEAIRDFGFDTPELSADLFLKKPNLIRMGVPPMRIEILNEISGVEFGSCYLNRVVDRIGDVEVDIISASDLKQNKKASGRFKDLDDLQNLP
jgi:hypothetical protein